MSGARLSVAAAAVTTRSFTAARARAGNLARPAALSTTTLFCTPPTTRRLLYTRNGFLRVNDSNMSDKDQDQAYMDFLNRANEAVNEPVAADEAPAVAAGRSSADFKVVDAGEAIPAALAKASGVFYVSDADEPFEPVVLKRDAAGNKGLPDEDEFLELIEAPAGTPVQMQDPSAWDGQGHYQKVVDAVRKATDGAGVCVYRVEAGGPRVVYFVVGCEAAGTSGRLVGLKALAIED